ncbi:MAG: hypothetical protein JNG89_16685 [Planctomycetaceae bacterium]|nr:hypothetical protein [Planctomycetaceae bacterium]
MIDLHGRHLLPLLLGLTLCAGCGESPYPELFPASGTITLDGAPLDGATVAFIPSKSNQMQPSYGYTDPDGKYELKTPEGYGGVSPGEYRIVISKIVMPDGSPVPPGSQTGGAEGDESIPYPHSDPRATSNVAVVAEGSDVFDVAIVSIQEQKRGR